MNEDKLPSEGEGPCNTESVCREGTLDCLFSISSLAVAARPLVPSIYPKNYNPFSSVTTLRSCSAGDPEPSSSCQGVRSQNSSKTNEGGGSIRGGAWWCHHWWCQQRKRAICGVAHGDGMGAVGATPILLPTINGHHCWQATTYHLGRASQMTKTHNGRWANICIIGIPFQEACNKAIKAMLVQKYRQVKA